MGDESRAWRTGREAWTRLAAWATGRGAEGRGADGDEALDALDDVGTLRRLLDQAELQAVRAARRTGRSWAEIATRLGISRQAAWERWRELDEAPTEPDDPAGALIARAAAEQVRLTDLRRRSNVAVPNVIGRTWAEAREVLFDAHLVAIQADPDAPPLELSEWTRRRVTDQSPESGAKVPPDTAVRLWLDADEGGAGVHEPRRPRGPKPKGARELDYDTGIAG